MIHTPERNIWIAHMYAMIDDALGRFKLPDVIDDTPALELFDKQYETMRRRYQKRGLKLKSRKQLYKDWGSGYGTEMARTWLEYSSFDRVANLVGYDSLFVNKIFDVVQYAITLESKLWNEFRHDI